MRRTGSAPRSAPRGPARPGRTATTCEGTPPSWSDIKRTARPRDPHGPGVFVISARRHERSVLARPGPTNRAGAPPPSWRRLASVGDLAGRSVLVRVALVVGAVDRRLHGGPQ